MIPYWQQLAEREKMMVSIAIVMMALALLYFIIIKPIHRYSENLKQQVLADQSLIIWLQKHMSEIAHLRQQARQKQNLLPENLLSNMAATLKESTIRNFSHDIRQTENGQVSLTFKEVPFDGLMAYTNSLWASYAIQIRSLSVSKIPKKGMVSAQVTFSL